MPIFFLLQIFISHIFMQETKIEKYSLLRTCLEKIRQEAVTPALKDYLDWLLKEPFVRFVVDVYEKKLFGEKKLMTH